MADAFDRALPVILHHEGGLVDHPKDPGGLTNLGATRASWSDWIGRPATAQDMRSLTPAKVAPFYRARYWDALKCGQMPLALALCVFDFGVNAGTGRGARYLQRLAGVAEDGIIGLRTLRAVEAFIAQHGLAEAVRQYQQARRAYYRKLPTFPTFGRGWLRRVDETETAALGMLP